MRNKKFIIGIDEVGRGALAGPVTVAAVAIPKKFRPGARRPNLGILKDSKKLSPFQRSRWFEYFKSEKFSYAVARVYPRSIERINISNAANRAATKALNRLTANSKQLTAARIFLDGGLFLDDQEIAAKTVIKGDEKIPAVAAASIVAKVSRDRYMEKLAKKHTGYGFEVHKGYGTRLHFAAIRQHGLVPVHRLTFLRKYPKVGSK